MRRFGGHRLIVCLCVVAWWASCLGQSTGLVATSGTFNTSGPKQIVLKSGGAEIPSLERIARIGPTAARLDAIRLLGAVGSPSEYEFLVGLVTDPDEAVRQPASSAIDAIFDREEIAFRRKIQELSDLFDASAATVAELKERLANLQPELMEISGRAPGTPTRDAVDLNKWRVEVLNYLDGMDAEKGENLLRNLLVGREKDGYIGSREPPFYKTCGNISDAARAWHCAMSMMWDKSPALFEKHLQDPDFRFRATLIDAMRQPSPRLKPLLIQLATDPVDSVRLAACASLSEFAGEDVQETLISLTYDHVGAIRDSALCSLSSVDSFSALEAASRLAKDDLVRDSALRTIESLSDVRCLPLLSDLLTGKDRKLACAATTGLGAIGSVQAIPVLTRIILSGPNDLRVEATASLGKLDSELVTLTLNRCLDDRDPDVIAAACEELSKVTDGKTLSKLRQLRSHSDPAVRKAADAAISRLMPPVSASPP